MKASILGSFVLAAVLDLLPLATLAQGHNTWRSLLLDRHLDDAIASPGVPDLDRELTSYGTDTSTGTVVAAYYFVDEENHGIELGPLHVSRFDRATHRWVHAAPVARNVGGSVMDVRSVGQHVLVFMHLTPSSGETGVFDAAALAFIGMVPGTVIQELRDGSLLYSGQMPHFAATHQDTLHVFDLRSGQSIEVFPGAHESPIAAKYRREIKSAFEKAPGAVKEEITRDSVYGAVHDYDRTIWSIVEGADGRSIAFVAVYDAERLGDIPHKSLDTAVRCRQGDHAWLCNESKLLDASRRLGIPLPRPKDGEYEKQAVDKFLHALADRP